ncbi:hypothetical protein BBJ28_00016678 [Nothophytophthora sp. Chile5]|nr:hypothetical protein BBJ28_00016678 [Nothophytophthora sp. Chile5]
MLTPSDCSCGHAHGDGHDHEQREPRQNPLPVLGVFVVFNVLFVSLGALLRFLAELLTLPGLLLGLVVVVVLGIRRVASLMAYPGQLSLVIREGEANFARLTKRRLQIFAEAAAELATVLDPARSSGLQRLRFLQAHQNFSFALETLVMPVLKSLEIVERDSTIGTNGTLLLEVLREIMALNEQKLAKACSELCGASSKDFEARRLKLFGAGAPRSIGVEPTAGAAATLEGDAATMTKPMASVHSVTALATLIQRLQAAILLIGRPQTEAPVTRNIAWVIKELFRRQKSKIDSIATLELLRADMAVRFVRSHVDSPDLGEQIWISGYQGHQVDAMLLPAASSGPDSVDRPVVLLCNPNGGLYEFHHLQMDWIKFYTSDLDCHVLVYNYRGYGRCKGSPNPEMHNLDALALVEYLKTERGMKKIAVHGESIGGMVATYLARKSPHVNVLIADRTFSSVPALAQRMVASWAGAVVKQVMRWDTDNVRNYLEAPCAKLLCSDPCDEIILDGASLKSGVALQLELGDKEFDLPRQREADGAPATPTPLTTFWRTMWAPAGGTRSTRRISEAASRPQVGEPITEAMVARFSDAVLSVGRRAMEYTVKREKEALEGTGTGGLHENAAKNSAKEPVGASVAASADTTHVAISMEAGEVDPSSAGEDATDENERHPMLPHESTVAPEPVAASAAFSEELLAVVWMQLARLDGYCGQCLLQAAESGGYDKIRAWTASLLAWGGRVPPARRSALSLEPFDRDGIFIVPITVAEAHATLQHLVEQYPPLKFDFDVGFLVLMLEYLNDALLRRWRQFDDEHSKESSSEAGGGKAKVGEGIAKAEKGKAKAKKGKAEVPLVICTGDPQLGYLLPLHCGHNKNYEEQEKLALVGFLRHVGECVVTAPASVDKPEGVALLFECRLAAFGAYLPHVKTDTDELRVVLAPGDSMLACSPLPSNTENGVDPRFEHAVVVARRGHCSFQDKLTYVAAAGAAALVLVNSEDSLIPLSSLEHERNNAFAVSVAKSDGEKLIDLATEQRDTGPLGLPDEIFMSMTAPISPVQQAQARMQFLVYINAPVAVYEVYMDAVESLGLPVERLDQLLGAIASEDGTQNGEGFEGHHFPSDTSDSSAWLSFFSSSAARLSKWEFANEAALHASVAAAVLEIQRWTAAAAETLSDSGRLVLRSAALKLAEAGYYSHSAALLHRQPVIAGDQVDDSEQCLLAFMRFLQGDLLESLSETMACAALDLDDGMPSLHVAQETFLRLVRLKASGHDRECLRIAVAANDTNLSSTCCFLNEHSGRLDEPASPPSRQFSSPFTKELFHASNVMGVFLDELGAFTEYEGASLCIFAIRFHFLNNGGVYCTQLRQILAVPVVFASQDEMNSFFTEMMLKLQTFTAATKSERPLREQVVSPLGETEGTSGSAKTSLTPRPEHAAYLQFTITPPTMLIGYQSHKRRRIGFISTWFRSHSVGKLLLGVIQKLDRTKFHIVIYRCVHFLRDADELTQSFERAADEYLELPTDQESAVRVLRQARLDVVVYPELGMDEWTVLLSHHRVASVQCVFWGHPITTGNPHIDYFISSEHFVSKHFDEATEVPNAADKSGLELSQYSRASPVVTLPAAQSVVHLAAGFLRYMNASDCIAQSPDEYVALAVAIARNPNDIRARLLAYRSAIYQDTSTIEDWNTFLATIVPTESNLAQA